MAAKAVCNVDRGCGRRQAGGIYLEVGIGHGGLPVECFIVDPVIVIPTETQLAYGLTPQGVTLIERPDGVVDVWDIVGENYYPNPADFIEESRKYGVSRRVRGNLDFSRLTAASRLIVLHCKAGIYNNSLYALDWRKRCPKVEAAERGASVSIPHTHERPAAEHQTLCASIWWEDVLPGGKDKVGVSGDPVRGIFRAMPPKSPSWAYMARRRPEGVIPIYSLGLLANFPISRLAVVNDPRGQKHLRAMNAAGKSGLPVEVEDE